MNACRNCREPLPNHVTDRYCAFCIIDVVNLEKVCDILKSGDIPAYVEQTGGGTATIYAGVPYTDSEGNRRFPALCGPGWFDGPGWTHAHATTHDLYIGPDDDGESEYHITKPGTTEQDIARITAEFVKKHKDNA